MKRAREFLDAFAYWGLAALLLGFGLLSMAIGPPFFIIGLALAILGPFRDRRRVFWPVLIAVFAFELGFLVVTPSTCGRSVPVTSENGKAIRVPSSSTECSSLAGIRYNYEPGFLPGLVTGVMAGAAGFYSTRRLVRT